MMNYEDFKQIIKEEMEKTFSGDYEVRIQTVPKVNEDLDGLFLVKKNPEGNISPVVYINAMYEGYQNGQSLESVLSSFRQMIMETPDKSEYIAGVIQNFDTAKDNLVFALINTEQNRNLLQNVPNRSWNDLSIIYRQILKRGQEGIVSTIITNDQAERWGLTEEQLFSLATKNTKQILPVTVESMSDLIRESMPAEEMEIMDLLPEKPEMYVISNAAKINGAASVLYEEHLHLLSERIGTDLYILPSSVHEVLAVSVEFGTEFGTPEELSQMVQDVNNEQLDLADRLSNNVYHYDKDLRKISLATDAPAIGKEQDLTEDIRVQTASAQAEQVNRTNPNLGRGR